jgi:hypothetical protein
VLAEWDVRCAAGAVRDAAAYLFGLIRKALQGTFRLWAARKNAAQGQPAPSVQEATRKPLQAPSAAEPPVTEADPPASREVAWAHLQHIQAMLRGAAPVIAPRPGRGRPPAPRVRALAQAMPSTGQPRPLAAFLTPLMETGR